MLSQTFKEQRPELSTIAPFTPRTRTVPRSPQPAASVGLLELILQTLEDGKAEDIVTIELAGKTTIADQMVIATGRSTRQVLALADHLEEALSQRMPVGALKAREAQLLLGALPAGARLVALDERGAAWTSRGLADRLARWR